MEPGAQPAGVPTVRRRIPRPLAVLARWSARLAGGALLVVLGGLLLMAFRARSMPDLQRWHLEQPPGEFRAKMETRDFDFDDYLAVEEQVFEGLAAFEPDAERLRSRFVRYRADGPSDPETFPRNWNRSWELVPEKPLGSVLLLHGLTDSPYSLRSVAELFHELGFHVLSLRLPGHGTVPAALLKISWRDWEAAVRVAARYVAARGEGGPFYVGGYSCGGALAVSYALQALDDEDLPAPSRLFLFSPAIGITALARASNWHRAYSWIPYFKKSRWLGIEPEFDPFKYNSFPKNAGAQMWLLSRACQGRIARTCAAGRIGELPPMLTFQSVVDATIVARAVVDQLYERLEAGGNELVAFDLNQVVDLEGLFAQDPRVALHALRDDRTHPFDFTVITNESEDSSRVVAMTKAAGAREVAIEPLGLEWPDQVYSLSHVAIPFPPDDPVYGSVQPQGEVRHLLVGQLMLRGERDVLDISASQLMRIRSNPFHAYMLERIRATAAEGLGAAPIEAGGGRPR